MGCSYWAGLDHAQELNTGIVVFTAWRRGEHFTQNGSLPCRTNGRNPQSESAQPARSQALLSMQSGRKGRTVRIGANFLPSVPASLAPSAVEGAPDHETQQIATAAHDPGCVKTKSDLVVMLSEGRIFAFFALSATTSLKILGAVIPRGVFTQPGPKAAVTWGAVRKRTVHCPAPRELTSL